MTEIILHHFDLSPFSEKIRLALGLKGLAWRSVKVEPVPPRPLLDTLTGGYRRVPVVQMGADISCDTEVIFRALEQVQPTPTLYPTGEGLSKALSQWLSSMLAANGPFLTGDRISAADLSCHHSLWLLRANAGAEAIDRQLSPGRDITDWMARVAALGHGRPTGMSPEAALAVATVATPAAPTLGANDPSGIAVGTVVSLTPEDNARVPVIGTLVAADAQEAVIAIDSPHAGPPHVHCPRAGFEVLPAAARAALSFEHEEPR